jgi:transcriptional regulator with XRE-family HTH domain
MSALELGKFAPQMETLFRLLPVLKVSFTEFAQEFETSLRRIRRAPKPKPAPAADEPPPDSTPA